MSESVLHKSQCLNSLPPQWPEDLLPGIREKVGASGRKIIVLDDDPTGTQTVHDIAVRTTWSVEDIREELENPSPAFYILSNSRSLPPSEARRLGREIGANIRTAAERSGKEVTIISRSDSTLRGHFPDESDAVAEAMGCPGLPYLIIPFFLEGGRCTIDNIHYVAEGDDLVPAAQTSYAQDAAFGFRNSNLVKWVEEKTGGRIPAEDVASVSLSDLREKGPGRVREILCGLKAGSACVVNAASYRDMEVFVAGLLEAEDSGKNFLFRTAASFVRVRAGIIPRKHMIAAKELTASDTNGGLFLVGSYVPKSTEQVRHLTEHTDISVIEVDVPRLLSDDGQEQETDRVISAMNRLIRQGDDVVICTSRKLRKGKDAVSSLAIGNRVSDSLIRIVQGLAYRPRYLLAKGGITSSDTASKGLGVKRAMVMGQALPGVPVWQLGEETPYPGMAYIVFPGNVGNADALTQIRQRLVRS